MLLASLCPNPPLFYIEEVHNTQYNCYLPLSYYFGANNLIELTERFNKTSCFSGCQMFLHKFLKLKNF